jgi:hypothetical protein
MFSIINGFELINLQSWTSRSQESTHFSDLVTVICKLLHSTYFHTAFKIKPQTLTVHIIVSTYIHQKNLEVSISRGGEYEDIEYSAV